MPTQQDFIKMISPIAIASMNKNKILASIAISQACLESGYGKAAMMMINNAPFGVKATDSWLNIGGKAYNAVTGEVIKGQSIHGLFIRSRENALLLIKMFQVKILL